MNEKNDLTSTELTPPSSEGVTAPQETEKDEYANKPKPPFVALFFVTERDTLCSVCNLPGGKLNFLDSLGRPWTIKTGSNLRNGPNDTCYHENPYVCEAGKNIKVLPKPVMCEACEKGKHLKCPGHSKGNCECGCANKTNSEIS